MSLIPEPPQIYRSGAWRRGGITVEPVYIRTQGTNNQVYTGNGGLVAEFNAWNLSPLSDPDCIGEDEFQDVGDIYPSTHPPWDYFDVLAFNSTIYDHYSEPRTFLVDNHLFYIQSRAKRCYCEGQYHYAIWHGGNPGATPPYSDAGHYGHDTIAFRDDTGAIADLLVAKINIDDGTITSASQVCMTMSVSLNHVGMDSYYAVFNYDTTVSISSVTSFLAQQTGLSEKHFIGSHSTGGSATWNNNTWKFTTPSNISEEDARDNSWYQTSLPSMWAQGSFNGWRVADSALWGYYRLPGIGAQYQNMAYPAPDWFVPYDDDNDVERALSRRTEYEENTAAGQTGSFTLAQGGYIGEFLEIPRWAGIDTVNGVVSSRLKIETPEFHDDGSLWFYDSMYYAVIEVSSFDTNLSDIAGIGRSEFIGPFQDLLLDNESSDVEYEIDSVSDELKAAIEGPLLSTYCSTASHPYGGSSSYHGDASIAALGQIEPTTWLTPIAEARPETYDLQYFWSNLEGAKEHLPVYLTIQRQYSQHAKMHYRISV